MIPFSGFDWINFRGAVTYVRDGSKTIWFTWTGSKLHRTLWAIGRHAKLKIDGTAEPTDDLTLTFNNTVEEVQQAYKHILLEKTPTTEELALNFCRKSTEKYDYLLSEELQTLLFAKNRLSSDGIQSLILPTFVK